MVRFTKKHYIIILLAILILASVGYVWHRHNSKQLIQTTSKLPTAQNDYTGGTTHKSTASQSGNNGVATDNHGDSSVTSDSGGISSTGGLLKVVSPASGALLASGDVLKGVATSITSVQYRVVDDQIGVLAQGALDVVNGTYSGTLHFTAKSTTGRLDIFSLNAGGQEVNTVEVPVTFK